MRPSTSRSSAEKATPRLRIGSPRIAGTRGDAGFRLLITRSPSSASSPCSGGRGHNAGGGRSDSAAVREQFPRIVEQDDTVAEQAPPLLGMAGHNVRGAAIWCFRIRARWLVLTHLILRNGELVPGLARLSLAPARAGPHWPVLGRGHHLWLPAVPPSWLRVGHKGAGQSSVAPTDLGLVGPHDTPACLIAWPMCCVTSRGPGCQTRPHLWPAGCARRHGSSTRPPSP